MVSSGSYDSGGDDGDDDVLFYEFVCPVFASSPLNGQFQ